MPSKNYFLTYPDNQGGHGIIDLLINRNLSTDRLIKEVADLPPKIVESTTEIKTKLDDVPDSVGSLISGKLTDFEGHINTKLDSVPDSIGVLISGNLTELHSHLQEIKNGMRQIALNSAIKELDGDLNLDEKTIGQILKALKIMNDIEEKILGSYHDNEVKNFLKKINSEIVGNKIINNKNELNELCAQLGSGLSQEKKFRLFFSLNRMRLSMLNNFMLSKVSTTTPVAEEGTVKENNPGVNGDASQ